MDLNRNQFFLAGLVILFLGIQFRLIESVVFTPQFSRLLVENSNPGALAASDAMNSVFGTPQVSPVTVRPPDWFGWSLLSAGSVLILHAMAMRKPTG